MSDADHSSVGRSDLLRELATQQRQLAADKREIDVLRAQCVTLAKTIEMLGHVYDAAEAVLETHSREAFCLLAARVEAARMMGAMR